MERRLARCSCAFIGTLNAPETGILGISVSNICDADPWCHGSGVDCDAKSKGFMEEDCWAEEAADGEVSSGSAAHSANAALLCVTLTHSHETSTQVRYVQASTNTFI